MTKKGLDMLIWSTKMFPLFALLFLSKVDIMKSYDLCIGVCFLRKRPIALLKPNLDIASRFSQLLWLLSKEVEDLLLQHLCISKIWILNNQAWDNYSINIPLIFFDLCCRTIRRGICWWQMKIHFEKSKGCKSPHLQIGMRILSRVVAVPENDTKQGGWLALYPTVSWTTRDDKCSTVKDDVVLKQS